MNKTPEQLIEEVNKRIGEYKDKQVCPEYQEILDRDEGYQEFLDTLEEENRAFNRGE